LENILQAAEAGPSKIPGKGLLSSLSQAPPPPGLRFTDFTRGINR